MTLQSLPQMVINHTRFFLVQHSSNLIQHSYGKSSCQKFAKHMFRCSGTQGCLFIIKLAGCLMLGCPIHQREQNDSRSLSQRITRYLTVWLPFGLSNWMLDCLKCRTHSFKQPWLRHLPWRGLLYCFIFFCKPSWLDYPSETNLIWCQIEVPIKI